jgi:hypothetical protein
MNHEIIDYAKEKQLSTEEVMEWFMWLVNNLLSMEQIKEGIDLGLKPIEVWRRDAKP